jgi:predicted NAD/FAD-binding protein
MDKKLRVAIVGSGISGLVCAYFLNKNYDIKFYEKNDYIGGHSNTVDVNYEGKKIAVDTGFIVFNHQTYPNLKAFFELLDVAYEKSNMSFAVKIGDSKIEYAGTNLNAVFAQRKNILNPRFIKMLLDILRFNKLAHNLLNQGFNPDYSMMNFLQDLKVGKYFRDYYLLPMASAIWSTPLDKIHDYPASSFVQFFKNHGLLTVSDQPQWLTVSKGSRQYVKKVCTDFNDKISLNDEVKNIYQNSDKKWVIESHKSTEIFDKIVIASHADQALKILKNPTQQQQEILSSFSYQKNLAILHKDSAVMPKAKNAWASWVYSHNSSAKNLAKNNLSVSYWMNNLQNIDYSYPLFVTLNPNIEIDAKNIFAKFEYEHPIFDAKAIKAQARIDEIQGQDDIYFCGAYQSFGFHEDGISSALRVLNKMQIKAPWQ